MKAISVFLILISPCFVISQDLNQDFGTWTKINSDFKINKKTSFTNKTELRTLDNSSQISQFYTQFSLNKKLNKKLSTSFAWRLRLLNKEYSFLLANRFHNDLNFKHKISDLSSIAPT